jgi:DDE family transposase
VSAGGLVAVLALADRVGLRILAEQHLTVPTDRGAHAGSKVASLVAGMIAGADSIEDMNLLRHGGMARSFTGTYAPSTPGSFLRGFGFGQVRQLDAVAARPAANLATHTPLLPDASQIAYLDVDDTVRATYGRAMQGAGYGYTGVKGLNALLATLSTPASAPVIVASRLRKGSANSARGAARRVADALKTSAACGATGLLVVRADSAFYGRDVIAAIRGAGARFSITARQDAAVRRAIAAIGDDAWTTVRYPRAVFDEQLGQWSAPPRFSQRTPRRVRWVMSRAAPRAQPHVGARF